MTANREPSNQSFETDREATVCTANRRFLLSFHFTGKPQKLSSRPNYRVEYLSGSIHGNLAANQGTQSSFPNSLSLTKTTETGKLQP
jgi:hypothetical protein